MEDLKIHIAKMLNTTDFLESDAEALKIVSLFYTSSGYIKQNDILSDLIKTNKFHQNINSLNPDNNLSVHYILNNFLHNGRSIADLIPQFIEFNLDFILFDPIEKKANIDSAQIDIVDNCSFAKQLILKLLGLLADSSLYTQSNVRDMIDTAEELDRRINSNLFSFREYCRDIAQHEFTSFESNGLQLVFLLLHEYNKFATLKLMFIYMRLLLIRNNGKQIKSSLSDYLDKFEKYLPEDLMQNKRNNELLAKFGDCFLKGCGLDSSILQTEFFIKFDTNKKLLMSLMIDNIEEIFEQKFQRNQKTTIKQAIREQCDANIDIDLLRIVNCTENGVELLNNLRAVFDLFETFPDDPNVEVCYVDPIKARNPLHRYLPTPKEPSNLRPNWETPPPRPSQPKPNKQKTNLRPDWETPPPRPSQPKPNKYRYCIFYY